MGGQEDGWARARLAQCGWFQRHDAATREAILHAGTLLRLGAAERLCAAGEPAEHAYVLLEGELRLVIELQPGKHNLVSGARPLWWFGLVGLLPDNRRMLDVRARTDSVVMALSREAAERIGAADPAFWRLVAELVARDYRMALAALVNSMVPSTRRRVALKLLEVQAHGTLSGSPAPEILRLRQDELAELLAMTRQTLNRTLRELERANLVKLGYGWIELVDTASLRLVAETELVTAMAG
jgi:CRP-like cAMP-binding protein